MLGIIIAGITDIVALLQNALIGAYAPLDHDPSSQGEQKRGYRFYIDVQREKNRKTVEDGCFVRVLRTRRPDPNMLG